MQSFFEEVKAIFKSRKVLIPIIAVLFIPLLYSGMLLYAFWDPYDQLSDLPVAVVNMDEGAQFETKQLTIGNDLVKRLQDNPKFKWEFVDEDEAEQGLHDQKYYMVIKIPDNFSGNATTLLNERPLPAEIEFIPNVGTNFISSQIGEKAVEQLKNEVANQLTKTYAATLFDTFEKMADGFQTADDGAGQINDGISEIDHGVQELRDHLEGLAKNSIVFKEGLQTASNGSKQLASGMNEFNNGINKMKAGQEELLNGSTKLEKGTTDLSDGLQQSLNKVELIQGNMAGLFQGASGLKKGATNLSAGIQSWNDGFKQYQAVQEESFAELTTNLQSFASTLSLEQQQQLVKIINKASEESMGGQQASASLSQTAEQLIASAAELSDGAADLYEGNLLLKDGMTRLESGQTALLAGATDMEAGQKQIVKGLTLFGTKIDEASAGANQLLVGYSNLDMGLGELTTNSVKLEDGTQKLADGSKDLTVGMDQLYTGTKELKGKLSDAAKESASINGNEKLYDMMAEPVHIATNKVNDVPNYGTGFTPYFLSLGLFVGALILTIVFPLRVPAGVPKSGFSWFIGKFGIISIAVMIQSILVDFVLLKGLGIEVQSVSLFILFSILTSITFMSLIQFFVTTLSDVGRFIVIIFLVFQLTTSAGTFPLELLPSFLQHFNAWLPMSYTVSGFRTVISSHDLSLMWHNVGALLVFLFTTLAATITYFIVKYNKVYHLKKTEISSTIS